MTILKMLLFCLMILPWHAQATFVSLRSCPGAGTAQHDFAQAPNIENTTTLCEALKPDECVRDDGSCRPNITMFGFGLRLVTSSMRPTCSFAAKNLAKMTASDFTSYLAGTSMQLPSISLVLARYMEGRDRPQQWCEWQTALANSTAFIQALINLTSDTSLPLIERLRLYGFLKHFAPSQAAPLHDTLNRELDQVLKSGARDIPLEELRELVRISYYLLSPGLDYFVRLARTSFGQSPLTGKVRKALSVFHDMPFVDETQATLQRLYFEIGYIEGMKSGNLIDYINYYGPGHEQFIDAIDRYFLKTSEEQKKPEHTIGSLFVILSIKDMPGIYSEHILEKAYALYQEKKSAGQLTLRQENKIKLYLAEELVRRNPSLEVNRLYIPNLLDLSVINGRDTWEPFARVMSELKKNPALKQKITSEYDYPFVQRALAHSRPADRAEILAQVSSTSFTKAQIEYLLMLVNAPYSKIQAGPERELWNKLINQSQATSQEKATLRAQL